MVTPVSALQPSHRFSCLKLTFLLIFILNYEIEEPLETHRQYFQRDLSICNECFRHQFSQCQTYFNAIEYDVLSDPWQNIINLLPKNTKRATNFLRFRNNTQKRRIIAKYLTQQKVDTISLPPNVTHLREQFFDSTRLDGLQFCPAKHIEGRFINYLQQHTKSTVLSIWLHLILNLEPLLMPHLETLGYPVPMHYAVCGFTLYQAYAGRALIYYYDAEFKLKLNIAKQLLEAAIKFSRGFAGFRIYITDLNADNVVYNEQTQKIYFVDLDTVLIVDSEYSSHHRKDSMHKHIYIDCDNCFAYSQQDICDNGLSDINLFATCQLLRENLNRQREEGFLYPIPVDITETYPNFQRLLDNCVGCSDALCENRFAATLDLIELFNVILKDFY